MSTVVNPQALGRKWLLKRKPVNGKKPGKPEGLSHGKASCSSLEMSAIEGEEGGVDSHLHLSNGY